MFRRIYYRLRGLVNADVIALCRVDVELELLLEYLKVAEKPGMNVIPSMFDPIREYVLRVQHRDLETMSLKSRRRCVDKMVRAKYHHYQKWLAAFPGEIVSQSSL